MYQMKILLGTASICSLILALVMLWNEERTSLTFFETKSCETLFIIISILLAKDYAEIKVK